MHGTPQAQPVRRATLKPGDSISLSTKRRNASGFTLKPELETVLPADPQRAVALPAMGTWADAVLLQRDQARCKSWAFRTRR